MSLTTSSTRDPHVLRRRGLRLAGALVAVLLSAFSSSPRAQVSATPIIGTIESIKVNDINDPWSGGEMVVSGQRIIIPRNLLIDLPANRLTLTDLFLDGPTQCFNQNPPQSGLATSDTCQGKVGANATIFANRIDCGDLVAGDVFIAKSIDSLTGNITYINYSDGYFRINGTPNQNAGGIMVRINDPDGRHTLQRGPGCSTFTNCSPDPRFGVDPDNYTVTFSTGYPLCIPSTMTGGLRTTGSSATGTGDPFCPSTNRGNPTAADSRRFAPIAVGDHVLLEGNYETVNTVKFFSAWHAQLGSALFTRDAADQPDYIIFDEVGWDAPGFNNQRVRLLTIGFSTLPDSQLDIFALRVDPSDNSNHEQILASTVNNPQFINIGIPPTAANIWKILFDVDFLAANKADRLPCATLAAAAPNPLPQSWANFVENCQGIGGVTGDFRMLSPLTREIIAHTRRRTPVTATAADIQGQFAPSSRYLTPIGTPGFPEFVEVDLNRLGHPFTFAGVPWNLDRRLSPGGCSEAGCESAPQPLDPFPFEGTDNHPGTQVVIPDSDRPLTYFTFNGNGVAQPHQLTWPPATPACTPPQGGGGGGGGNVLAVNDRLITPAGAPLNFTAADLLANDTGASLSIVSIDAATSGGGTVASLGGGAFRYTPRTGFFGDDTFTYTISGSGGGTSTATVIVTVTDAINPTVAFVPPPAAGSTVTGTVTLTATASDNIGVASVQFFVNGTPLGIADNVAPYQATWNTTGLANTTFVIGVQAQDLAGNVSNVVTENLVVNNVVAPPPTGLVLELFFDEPNGATALDTSGGNRNGTIVNATRVTAGKVGGALSFNGTNALVTVADAAALDLTTGMTLEAWVQPTSPLLNGWRTVMLKERTGGLAYGMYAQDGGTQPGGRPGPAGYANIGGVDRSVAGPTALAANTWVHVALTYDGANLRFFVNGGQVAVVAQTGAMVNGNGPLQIGGNNVFSTPTTEFFKGLIDEVRVYNRALTAAEITADMNKVR